MRKFPFSLLAAGLFVAAAISGVKAQSFSATHAQVDLVSEGNAVQAGRVSWLGLRFNLEKGWHIYWVNPGDAGGPPAIQWQLPSGFRAGEIRWAVPTRLTTGTVIDYGYEGQVLLPVSLQVPADYKPGTPVKLAADVRYLICREVCIPAKTHVALSIPESGGPAGGASARSALFQEARERLPKRPPAGMKTLVADDGKNFLLTVDTGTREVSAAFFPLMEDQIENAAPQPVTPSATGVRVSLKKSAELTKPIATLKGVLVLGPGHAFEIAAPVTASR